MGLSPEQRETCADIYLAITDGDLEMPDYRWNEEGAIELYKMLARI